MNKPTTAAAAYEQAADHIAAQIVALQAALAEHRARANADARNWGFSGDLQAVREQLAEALFVLGA